MLHRRRILSEMLEFREIGGNLSVSIGGESLTFSEQPYILQFDVQLPLKEPYFERFAILHVNAQSHKKTNFILVVSWARSQVFNSILPIRRDDINKQWYDLHDIKVKAEFTRACHEFS